MNLKNFLSSKSKEKPLIENRLTFRSAELKIRVWVIFLLNFWVKFSLRNRDCLRLSTYRAVLALKIEASIKNLWPVAIFPKKCSFLVSECPKIRPSFRKANLPKTPLQEISQLPLPSLRLGLLEEVYNLKPLSEWYLYSLKYNLSWSSCRAGLVS